MGKLLMAVAVGAVCAEVCAGTSQLADVQVVGVGTPGRAGVPELHLSGPLVPGQPVPSLRIVGGRPHAAAQWILGTPGTPTALPAFGATLHVGQPWARFGTQLDGAGESPSLFPQPGEWPADLLGLTLALQALVLDPTARGGAAFTAGLVAPVGAGSVAASLFEAADWLATGPSSTLCVGDLDGQGGLDGVVVADTGEVSVGLHGYGDTLVPVPGAVPAAFLVRDGAVADVDGDGLGDLVLAGAGGLETRLGTGDGGFSAAGVHAAGDDLQRLRLADIDGDGRLDVLATRTDDGDVTRLLGVSGGPWSAAGVVVTGLFASSDLGLGDVDADGDLDLAVLDGSVPFASGSVAVLLNDGAGAFATQPLLTPDISLTSPRAVALGDLDGDGRSDLVLGSQGGGSFFHPPAVGVQLGLGGGAFGPVASQPCGVPARSLWLEDLDGDGLADVLVEGHAGAALLKGLGAGALSDHEFVESRLASDRALAVDGDGLPDLWSLQVGALVTRADDIGQLTVAEPLWHDLAYELTDLDGDGALDVLTLAAAPVSAGETAVGVSLGLGDGRFGDVQPAVAGEWVTWIHVGELTGDGVPDLVSLVPNGLWVDARLHVGLGDGSFAAGEVFAEQTSLSYTRLVDLDGDGDLDVVGAEAVVDTVATWLGDGQGGFTSGAVLDLETGLGDGYPYAPALLDPGDVDGDGWADLVVARRDTAVAEVRRGLGDGSFGPPEPVALAFVPRLVDLADVDGDGVLDLIAVGPCPIGPTPDILEDLPVNRVLVHLGLGDGSFADSAAADEPVPACGSWIEVADVDGDGSRDVLVSAQGGFSLALGLGAGRLAPVQPFRAPTGVVLPGDLDHDGDLDLVVAGISGSEVLVNRLR